MAAGTLIKHKRKAGAFVGGELAAGEFGVDVSTPAVYYSKDGTTVTQVGAGAGTVDTANSPNANEFARFTDPDTIEGRTVSEAKADLGLDNVTNESKATMLTNAALTGSPTAPTPSAGDNSTKISTTAFVQGELASVVLGIQKRSVVRAATTANITIATALNNGSVLDGVTLATNDLVLVKDQSAPEQNGVYVVGPSPARSAQYDTYDEHTSAIIIVQEGSSNLNTIWFSTSNAGGTLNTTAINFSKLVIAGELLAANNLSDLSNAGTARSNLGLAIGSNVQAYDAELNAIAGLTSAADKLPYFSGSGAAALVDFTAFIRTLMDDADAATARGTLGAAASSHTHAASDIVSGTMNNSAVTIDGGTI